MDRRTGESPMDFSWDNGKGPIDNSSPFVSSFTRSQATPAAKKRTHRVFDSPTKPQTPTFREPASQTYLFSSPAITKPLPALPEKFRTPRSKVEIDFSSGGETPNTPDTNIDSDATPEKMAKLSKSNSLLGKFTSNASSSGKSPKKESSSLMKFLSGSPSRKYYSDKAEKRVKKRRTRELEKRVTRQQKGLDSDSEDGKTLSNHQSQNAENANSPSNHPRPSIVGTVLSFIDTHPNLPHILSWYAQLAVNIFVCALFMYICWSVWRTIIADVDEASRDAVADVMAEMAACATNYRENRCDPSTRVPAMETICSNWEKCMNRDPYAVGRARVSAKTFAQILNSFIDPISWKTMAFTLLLIFGGFLSSNLAFNIFRNKHSIDPSAVHSNYMHPPQTPHRQPSGGFTPMQHSFYSAPFNQGHMMGGMGHMGIEPTPSGAPGVEGTGSPVKAIGYR